ncbi:uncharacterized protein LOC62_06G007796 [Vanrija pseudolonga]|uniref:Uncharacterized protein n=1 Tax=Vanrija pseudolonga TaxID=143232 RepID=A0AAF0YG75_9TREE|nr:hypothetical protein LOC62_06G007796 [Vanrija pseudolonga]
MSRPQVIQEDEASARNPAHLDQELKGARVWRAGGIGIFAYSLDGGLEGTKNRVYKDWNGSFDASLYGARQRTAAFRNARQNGWVVPLVRWELVEDGQRIPPDAIQIGNEANGQPLYSARVFLNGGVEVGKAGHHISGAEIPYFGEGKHFRTFEVLVGDGSVVQWYPFHPGWADSHPAGTQAVDGGRTGDGKAELIARTNEFGLAFTEYIARDDHAYVAYGGEEKRNVRNFEILAFPNLSAR